MTKGLKQLNGLTNIKSADKNKGVYTSLKMIQDKFLKNQQNNDAKQNM